MSHKINKYFFITGTDTDIGKTYVTVALLKILKQAGFSTIALKPVASGCAIKDNVLKNADALLLQQHASIYLDYQYINPISFAAPIAPHIAAAQLKQKLSVTMLLKKTQFALQHAANFHLIEGVGGWEVPLNKKATMANYAQALNINFNIEVVLVVGIRLGCINHAILTEKAIKNSGLRCAGWVANEIEFAQPDFTEIVRTLKTWLESPCLGILKYDAHFEKNPLPLAL